MRILFHITIIFILLGTVLPVTAKSSNKPFAAWNLPDSEFAYLTPND